MPEPSAKAMEFYRSGNWLWVFNRLWAIARAGGLAFSGFSARLRNLAQRLGGDWFFTVGLYMVMYLAVVFVIDLPLSYYEGFVRLHAYGLSNQTLGQVVPRLGRSPGRRRWPSGSPSPGFPICSGPKSAALVALHGAPLGPVPVRDDAGRADLDRSRCSTSSGR